MAALSTIAPFGFDFEPVEFLSAYRALGCASCQFYRNEERPPTAAEALRAADAAGLRYDSIHGVFGHDYDPSSADADHRARCLEVYEREGRLALELGGPMVVVHPAAWNPERGEMTPEEARRAQEPRWPHLNDFLARLAEVGERLGVTYLIENQPFNCPLGHDAVALAEHVATVGSERIRMCLDVGHAHITGDVVEAVERAAGVVAYLHVHDNDGRADSHRMPGDGSIDWAGFAESLRRCAPGRVRMLEVFYEPERVSRLAAEGLGERLRGMLAL